MQIERMGRPAVSTALVGLRDPSDVATMKKDAYNVADNPNMWSAALIASGRSIRAEIAGNLGLLDVLDKGNPTIPGTGMNAPGCRNQMLFNGNPTGGGIAGPNSYNTLAGFFADDMLYVDTTKTTCNRYFALELEVGTAGAVIHTECGGRAPKHDVIDVSYSLLIAGLPGLTPQPNLLPRLGDGVTAHADITDTFPYFGPPH
jgi:hypothetical protein